MGFSFPVYLGKEFRKQKITVKEFAEILNYQGHKLYEYMQGFEDSLSTRKISIKFPNGDRLSIPWFGYMKYINHTGTLEIAFNYDLCPFLLELDIPYTKYYLKNVKPLDSIYAIRIYELLKQYENTKIKGELWGRTIEIDELKQILGIPPNEYKLYADFKRRVIFQAQKEINKKTDIIFEFEEIKSSGKKIKSLKFIIHKNNLVNEKEVAVTLDYIQEIKTKFKNSYRSDLQANLIQKMIDSKGVEHVRNVLNNFKDYIGQSQIKHIERFFYSCVMDSYTKSTSHIPTPAYTNFNQREYNDEDWEEIIKINKEKYMNSYKIAELKVENQVDVDEFNNLAPEELKKAERIN
ncbi:TPA: hypothetical protein DCQ85_01170 [Candidatus Magasanikbacteria bacterium]|nr:hypothetical protein [Candidatus Magasanikbacteria bacterium]